MQNGMTRITDRLTIFTDIRNCSRASDESGNFICDCDTGTDADKA